ncbi:MAG: pantoate--beta-alanine ligase [Flavobacteriales bacterium]|nr:pantoate--beta-alanine ligase [Flavobacteriales bacterium]MCB9364286.1 pantoate--beta-alanine ligase [Flavobacteriales bacterium]
MLIFESVSALQQHLQENSNKSIGFVPTMGALHKGHLSLIDASQQKCELTVCSIFVNPTQFNKQEDLEKYPRNIEQDLKLLEQKKCDVVFLPTVEEMYDNYTFQEFDFGSLGNVMEGEHRPGHFNGVANVIQRFFEIINPTYAFFGEKDFQQLAIVKALVKQISSPTKIIGCPILREETGLAMSSRNERLNSSDRNEAQLIYKLLSDVKQKYLTCSVADMKNYFAENLTKTKKFELEYFDIADGNTLQPIADWSQSNYCVAFTAVNVGNVRLIDNITIFN